MIYLAHVDPTRKDMMKQSEFLVRSHKEVGINDQLIILKTDERKKFKQYGLNDKYALYNRYIAVMEYITRHNAENEIICVLDCDMFFQKKYTPLPISKSEMVSQMWIGGEDWKQYWNYVKDPEFDKFQERTKVDIDNPVKMIVPYYLHGTNCLALYKMALEVEKLIRQKTQWWMTEMVAVSFTSNCLNLKVKYDNIGCTSWFVDNPKQNPNGISIDDYPMIHYCIPVRGKKGTEIRKYKMHDEKFMLNEIDNFLKKDEPKEEIDRRVLDFYIRMYGYKAT